MYSTKWPHKEVHIVVAFGMVTNSIRELPQKETTKQYAIRPEIGNPARQMNKGPQAAQSSSRSSPREKGRTSERSHYRYT